MTEAYLKKAYKLETVDHTRDYYRNWAASYDAEITENGYQTPRRCAQALGRHCDNLNASLLDIGCGTGLSGLAFRMAGFVNLTGNDLSQEMLEIAKTRQIYDNLTLADLNQPLDFKQGLFDVIAAVGVISVGHAPPSAIAQMFDKLGPGGFFVFSINDASIDEGSFIPAVETLLTRQNAQLCEAEYDVHLPKINMKSYVYVIKKTA